MFGLCSRLRLYIVLLFAELRTQVIFRFVAARGPETLIKLLSISITLLMVAVIVQAVLSWINQHTPFAPVLNAITTPFIRPLQHHIPPAGTIDLSAFVLIILLQLTQMLPIYFLDKLVRSLI